MPYSNDSPVADCDTIRNLSEYQILELSYLSNALELGPASTGLLRFAAVGDIALHDYTGAWPANRAEMVVCFHAYDLAPLWLRDNMSGLLEAFRVDALDKERQAAAAPMTITEALAVPANTTSHLVAG